MISFKEILHPKFHPFSIYAFVCVCATLCVISLQAGAWPLTHVPSSTFAIPQELEKSVQMVS